METKREVYDVHAERASGSDESICYGVASTEEEAVRLFMSAQSTETLNSGYRFKAEVIRGVWAVTITDAD